MQGGGLPEFKSPEERIAYLTALSRGEIDVSSSDSHSDSDSESDSDSDGSDISFDDYGESGVLSDRVAAPTTEGLTTRHLAMMNFDWSKVRAVDVFVLASSFAGEGEVEKVEVFPSDFGMRKMEEDVLGPQVSVCV